MRTRVIAGIIIAAVATGTSWAQSLSAPPTKVDASGVHVWSLYPQIPAAEPVRDPIRQALAQGQPLAVTRVGLGPFIDMDNRRRDEDDAQRRRQDRELREQARRHEELRDRARRTEQWRERYRYYDRAYPPYTYSYPPRGYRYYDSPNGGYYHNPNTGYYYYPSRRYYYNPNTGQYYYSNPGYSYPNNRYDYPRR